MHIYSYSETNIYTTDEIYIFKPEILEEITYWVKW